MEIVLCIHRDKLRDKVHTYMVHTTNIYIQKYNKTKQKQKVKQKKL